VPSRCGEEKWMRETKKYRFDRLAQLCKSQVSGMLRLLRVKRFK
jgi:hypothetical protein